MNAYKKPFILSASVVVIGLWASRPTIGNGGPFVVKYPGGDPAAKGILARLDPSLLPAREERLRVIKEDLKISFTVEPELGAEFRLPPLAKVEAIYVIENPTDEEIDIDFGFPILRGVYVSPLSMAPRPDVGVRLNGTSLAANIISNSAIYGIIRQQARDVIEKAVAEDAALARLVAAVRATAAGRPGVAEKGARATDNDTAQAGAKAGERARAENVASGTIENDRQAARAALAQYLSEALHWQPADVALMVEYASLDFGAAPAVNVVPGLFWWGPGRELIQANLGPLAAIGEQKATQLFARLASRFDPQVAATYESIFSAWGGDVREKSVDLRTGSVRPREISISALGNAANRPYTLYDDPTIYARLEYLDPQARLSDAELASCQAVLRNLPVIFTFAPMNLLHYQAKFPAHSTQTLTVTYRQFAYADTAEPSTYQLAYVVHPASLWKEFGPIRLQVAVPEAVPFRASVACERRGTEHRPLRFGPDPGPSGESPMVPYALYETTLKDKTGELLVAVGAEAWEKTSRGGSEGSERQSLGGP